MSESYHIGMFGEEFTAQRLQQRGYRIAARNYHTPYGELDIIAVTQKYIVFVEVKTRRNTYMGTPEENVTPSKQKRLVRSALFYLQHHPTELQPRFDVAGVTVGPSNVVTGFHYLANAFEGKGLF